MKILFIVQGEGRGHLTQAITMEQLLRANGHEVVEVLVGKSGVRELPQFFCQSIAVPVKRFESPNFLPTPANKRNNITKSVAYNLMRFPAFFKSVCFINRRIKESGADLVVNFYELLTGIAYMLFRPSVPQVSIGHQYLFLHRDFEFPKANRAGLRMLCMFTRLTSMGAKERLALSFRSMDDDRNNRIRVVPPLLRGEIMKLEPYDGGYLHGYMVNSGFGKSVEEWHARHPQTPLHFFWDKKGAAPVTRIDETLTFHRINDRLFLESLAGCKAYATTAGFESVCEAMYLGKPVLMVPVHIEQDCNAYDACKYGAGITATDFSLDKLLEFSETSYSSDNNFRVWVESCANRVVSILEKVSETSHASIFTYAGLMPAISKYKGGRMIGRIMNKIETWH